MDDFSTSTPASPRAQTAFSAPVDVRYVGPLLGRYSFAATDEDGNSTTAIYACRTAGLSTTVASLVAPVPVPIRDHTRLLLDYVGLLQGHVTRATDSGFEMTIECTGFEREALAAKINWLKRYRLHKTEEKRKSGRFLPRRADATITLKDGTSARCLLIDVSTSGAAISAQVSPKIGDPVRLGALTGRVVRTMDVGFAMLFDGLCKKDEIEARIHTGGATPTQAPQSSFRPSPAE